MNKSQMAEVLEVVHAAGMVGAMPMHAHADYPPPVQTACLESFFINLRLLHEFLWAASSKGDPIRASDFVPGWKPKPSDDLRLAKRDLGFANEEVAHLSRKRVDGEHADVELETLRTIALRSIALLDEFDHAYHSTRSAALSAQPNSAAMAEELEDLAFGTPFTQAVILARIHLTMSRAD
jgi:hypothetical protein